MIRYELYFLKAPLTASFEDVQFFFLNFFWNRQYFGSNWQISLKLKKSVSTKVTATENSAKSLLILEINTAAVSTIHSPACRVLLLACLPVVDRLHAHYPCRPPYAGGTHLCCGCVGDLCHPLLWTIDVYILKRKQNKKKKKQKKKNDFSSALR